MWVPTKYIFQRTIMYRMLPSPILQLRWTKMQRLPIRPLLRCLEKVLCSRCLICLFRVRIILINNDNYNDYPYINSIKKVSWICTYPHSYYFFGIGMFFWGYSVRHNLWFYYRIWGCWCCTEDSVFCQGVYLFIDFRCFS